MQTRNHLKRNRILTGLFLVNVFALVNFGQNTIHKSETEIKSEKITSKPKYDIRNCDNEDYDCIIANETKKLSREKSERRRAYILQKRGTAYYKKGKYEHALQDFEKITNKNETVCRYLAYIYSVKGQYNEAYSIFYGILQRDPNDKEAYLGRGIVLNHLRNYQLALEDYDRAIFISAIFSRAYFYRGLSYIDMAEQFREYDYPEDDMEKLYKKAVKDFDMVEELDINSTAPQLYLKRSKVYEALGEEEKAEKDRIKYIEAESKSLKEL